MSGFLKFAIGVAVLGVVGLVGLSVLSIFWAVAAPNYPSGRVVAGVEVPARAAAVLPGQPARADDVWPVDTATQWGAPAKVQVNYAPQPTWSQTMPALALTQLLVLALGTIIVLYLVRKGRMRGAPSSGDTELVHELARRAQDLSQRMEALETILLDRTRAAR